MKIHQYNEMMRYLTRPKEDPSSEQQVAGLSDMFPGTFTSYQDAVYGPISYDLVSILKDCYIKWPKEEIDKWKQFNYTQSVQNIYC